MCLTADTEMAAEVEPSMETEERLTAEAEAAALRQARLASGYRCPAWPEGAENCQLRSVHLLLSSSVLS